jgi:hypothetical protein
MFVVVGIVYVQYVYVIHFFWPKLSHIFRSLVELCDYELWKNSHFIFCIATLFVLSSLSSTRTSFTNSQGALALQQQQSGPQKTQTKLDPPHFSTACIPSQYWLPPVLPVALVAGVVVFPFLEPGQNQMSAPSNKMQIMRTKPAVVEFSLYYPAMDSTTYQDIVPMIMPYIQQVLMCENHIVVVDSSHNKSSPTAVCRSKATTTTTTTLEFNMTAPYYGNMNNSVLMETPTLVYDESIGNIPFMKWRTLYYLIQLGAPLRDMTEQMMTTPTMGTTTVGSSNVTTTTTPSSFSTNDQVIPTHAISEIEVVDMMNSILKLGLQVNILEGTLDSVLQQHLPGARISLPGNERDTWSSLPFPKLEEEEDNENNNDDENGNQQQSHYGQNPHSPHPLLLYDSNDYDYRTGPSIVSASLQRSHALRYIGGILLLVGVVSLWLLHKLGRRRRRKREYIMYLQQETNNPLSLQLASEKNVLDMLLLAARNEPRFSLHPSPVWA